MFYGILVIDLSYSFNVVNKIRSFAVEKEIVIKYETLKQEIRRDTDLAKTRWRFLFAFNTGGKLSEKMEESLERIRFIKKQ